MISAIPQNCPGHQDAHPRTRSSPPQASTQGGYVTTACRLWVSILLDQGFIEARAVKQLAVFEAATLFAKTEGILPAPESAHAIRTAIDLAWKPKRKAKKRCILIGLSGHGHFDLASYEMYNTSQAPRLFSPRGGTGGGLCPNCQRSKAR